MKIYVLVVILFFRGGDLAVDIERQEFFGLERCEEVRDAIKDRLNDQMIYAECFETGRKFRKRK